MTNSKNEKILICGQSGSGKDHLLRGLIKMGLRYSPKITTRPKRSLEVDGVDYKFLINESFNKLKDENKIKFYQKFVIEEVDWFYAVDSENFENNQLFIVTPNEIEQLSSKDRRKCFVVYLDIPEDVRRSRITRRNDNNDSVERRIQSDKEDFKDFIDYDLRIVDSEFDIEMVYDLMF